METVVVTGAASGIGRATALAFARLGSRVVICDIDEEGLGETARQVTALGSKVLARRVDVARSEQVEALASEVHDSCAAVDVLVNNAGVTLAGRFLDTTPEDWEWILGINLGGVIHGCRAFLPRMIARGTGGHVVNVSSVAGYLAAEYAAAYSTSKFAMFGLSEALRDDLRAHGIGVSTVCPAIVDTAILDNARSRGGAASPGVQAQLKALYRRRNYSADKVAAQIVGAVRHRRTVVPVSPEAWVLYLLKRLSPNTAAALNRFVSSRGHQRIANEARVVRPAE